MRLSYEKWGGRDFLLGSADQYQNLNASHLKQLLTVLDQFAARHIGVILVPLTLPGARWRQMNGGKRDGRLWRDKRFWDASRSFWIHLAKELKGHPALVGLNLLNEPAPELESGRSTFWNADQLVWQQTVRGSAADLNAFHHHLWQGIRSVDPHIPLVLDAGLFATPWALPGIDPLPDANVLYSVHMYEPYEYTTWRKHQGKLRYPGELRLEDAKRSVETSAAWLQHFFEPVRQWLRSNQLGPERLIIGEFGCDRRCPGAAAYLTDLIALFERERWHWLFYSFREDNWDGMDYELGTQPPPAWYWDLSEKGGLETRYTDLYHTRKNNPLWQAIASKL